MEQLGGKVAVITGAASGIGRALADVLGEQGMKLALADIEGEPLAAAVAQLAGAGVEAVGLPTDVSNEKSMDRLAEFARARFGAVHVVCNNAGVGGGGSMWELTTADWEFVLGPNLWGVIHGVRVFAPHLVAQNEGHIVNTASVAGLVSAARLGPYNASKHAVVALSETLRAELLAANSAVGVSVLCPGFVNTRIFESARHRPEQAAAANTAALGGEVLGLLRASGALFLEPREVAAQVLDAIRSRRFYVFTHPGTHELVQQRLKAMAKGEAPPAPVLASFAAGET